MPNQSQPGLPMGSSQCRWRQGGSQWWNTPSCKYFITVSFPHTLFPALHAALHQASIHFVNSSTSCDTATNRTRAYIFLLYNSNLTPALWYVVVCGNLPRTPQISRCEDQVQCLLNRRPQCQLAVSMLSDGTVTVLDTTQRHAQLSRCFAACLMSSHNATWPKRGPEMTATVEECASKGGSSDNKNAELAW